MNQSGNAMKIGTDGVLLGAWAIPQQKGRILDIGTGTGLLALMLAQKTEAHIDALEIDKKAADEARINFNGSPWNDRLEIINLSLQDFSDNTGRVYDTVICNPPYFAGNLQPTSDTLSKAKHQLKLDYGTLIGCVSKLLITNGNFNTVFPFEDLETILHLAEQAGLYPSRILLVKPTPEKSAKRVLLEMGKTKYKVQKTELVIESNGRHGYSQGYQELLKDYLLDF